MLFSTSVYAAPVILPDDPLDDPILGDVNENGAVDTMDYIMVKRCVMGTYPIPENKIEIADMDGNGEIETSDYIRVKRLAMEM